MVTPAAGVAANGTRVPAESARLIVRSAVGSITFKVVSLASGEEPSNTNEPVMLIAVESTVVVVP